MNAASPLLHLNTPDGDDLPDALLERAVHLALAREGVVEGEVSITFLGDEAIRELNRQHLDHDWVPDVLSFALHDEGEALLGDVYVGLDQARRQARREGVPEEEELVRLAVHGLLHVLGHEHPEAPGDREDSRLYRLQEELVQAVFAVHGEDR